MRLRRLLRWSRRGEPQRPDADRVFALVAGSLAELPLALWEATEEERAFARELLRVEVDVAVAELRLVEGRLASMTGQFLGIDEEDSC